MANAVPLAPTLLSPDNNSVIIFSVPLVFTWNFNDPGDLQASASLRYQKTGDPGWTTLTDVVTSATTYTLPAGPLAQPLEYEWQTQTKDSAGQWSPWSGSRFFLTIAAIPPPVITAPAAAAVITASPMLVEWDLPVGFTQDAFLVTLTQNVAPFDLYYKSGLIVSTAQSVLADVATAAGEPMLVYVSFVYNGHQGSATRVVTNAILPPETPLIVLEQTPGKPEVVVTVTNPPASDAGHLTTVGVDVLRDGVRIKAGLAPNSTFTDRKVGAGEVDYRAVAVTANGGQATSF